MSTELFDVTLYFLKTDILRVAAIGKIFDERIQRRHAESDLSEGGLSDFVQRVCEIVFDFDGRW